MVAQPCYYPYNDVELGGNAQENLSTKEEKEKADAWVSQKNEKSRRTECS